jgi:ubiquinone/menaquinone biosynthesis C-methylase UbiE/catechol 2,3-dioxygenase-like lactoylglutathione lyase family enzyme
VIKIKRLDHVQLCIPVGAEERARQFYIGVLGMVEKKKPDSLLANGGVWFTAGEAELHVGVEKVALEASKCHPAFEVDHLAEARRVLTEAGIEISEEKQIPGVDRFSFRDPFGNRVELLESATSSHAVKRLVKEQFGRSAEAYVESDIHASGADLARLVAVSGAKAGDRVLDVATGGGHVASAIAPYVARVTALDLTPEMLAAASRFVATNGHSNVDFVEGDAEALPFEDASFDAVTCRIAPHHFANVRAFARECARVLVPGGRLLLVDNVAPEDDEKDRFYNTLEKRRDPSHVRAYKKSEWLRYLEEQGFAIEETHRFTKAFIFAPWCDRMHVSAEDQAALSAWMLEASPQLQEYFKVTTDGGYVYSWEGESILIRAVKR